VPEPSRFLNRSLILVMGLTPDVEKRIDYEGLYCEKRKGPL